MFIVKCSRLRHIRWSLLDRSTVYPLNGTQVGRIMFSMFGTMVVGIGKITFEAYVKLRLKCALLLIVDLCNGVTLAVHMLFHFKFGVNRCGSTFASTVNMCVVLACSNSDCVARIMNETKVKFSSFVCP